MAAAARSHPLTIENPPTVDSLTAAVNSRFPKLTRVAGFAAPEPPENSLYWSDPVRLFEKRVNRRRETGYEFDNGALMEYDHMTFGGPSVATETDEEAGEILRNDQKESDIGNF